MGIGNSKAEKRYIRLTIRYNLSPLPQTKRFEATEKRVYQGFNDFGLKHGYELRVELAISENAYGNQVHVFKIDKNQKEYKDDFIKFKLRNSKVQKEQLLIETFQWTCVKGMF